MVDNTRLSELLSRWEQLGKDGRSVTPEEMCHDCPDLLPEFKQHVAKLQAMDSFLGQSALPQTVDDASTLHVGSAPVISPDLERGPHNQMARSRSAEAMRAPSG